MDYWELAVEQSKVWIRLQKRGLSYEKLEPLSRTIRNTVSIAMGFVPRPEKDL